MAPKEALYQDVCSSIAIHTEKILQVLQRRGPNNWRRDDVLCHRPRKSYLRHACASLLRNFLEATYVTSESARSRGDHSHRFIMSLSDSCWTYALMVLYVFMNESWIDIGDDN
jgi:hypothetical protein